MNPKRLVMAGLKSTFDGLGLSIEKQNHYSDLQDLVQFLKPKITNYALRRIGGPKDGGYLIPDDLQGIEICLSPGSNKQWNFEKDLFDRYKIRSAIIDRSVNKPDDLYDEMHFTDSWLGAYDSNNQISIATWLDGLDLESDSDLMLQMDVEGAEYEILYSLPEYLLRRFRIIVIEFHYSFRLKNPQLFYEFYSKVFSRLSTHFEVVHFHPNNSCGQWNLKKVSLPIVFELTLIRKDRINGIAGHAKLPHQLDSDCDPTKPTSRFEFKSS